MRARLWLIVPLALGCQSKSASLSLTVDPKVGWLMAVYRAGDGSAVAASALTSAAEVVELELEDLPAPHLSVLGFEPAELEGLVSDAQVCGRFLPAQAGDPILPKPGWEAHYKRSSDGFTLIERPPDKPVELTAACLPACPPLLETPSHRSRLVFDVSCLGGDCSALPEQHQCTLDVALDGACAGATASFSIAGRGALSPIGACEPETTAPDALVSVKCAAPRGAECELSIYPAEERPSRVEVFPNSLDKDTKYVAVVAVADHVIFSRPYPRGDLAGSTFAFIVPATATIKDDGPAPPCADHLLAGQDGISFYATTCTVSPGRYGIGRFDGAYNHKAAPLGAALLSPEVSKIRGLALAGSQVLIAAEARAGDGFVEIREPKSLELRAMVQIPGRGDTPGAPVAIVGLGADRAVALDARLARLVAFNPLDRNVEPPVPIDVTAATATVGVLLATEPETVVVGLGPFIQRFGGRPLVALGPPRQPFAFKAESVRALSAIPPEGVLGVWGQPSEGGGWISTLALVEGGHIRLGATEVSNRPLGGPLIGGAVDNENRAWFTVPSEHEIFRVTVVNP